MVSIQIALAILLLPASAFAQTLEQVTVMNDWSNIRLEKAFLDVQRQTGYFFTFDRKQINNILITAPREALPLADLLKFISGKTGLKFTITKKLVLVGYERELQENSANPEKELKLIVPPVQTLAEESAKLRSNVIYRINPNEEQGPVLSGVVRSENGQTLVGASVIIKESGQGTVTDIGGKFSIAAPPQEAFSMVISYIGYETIEMPGDVKDMVSIILKESSTSLEEIVVIGYGKQNKVKVNGATTNVAGKALNRYSASGFDHQLIGWLSGVQVNQVNGQPGSEAQILVRGLGTLTAGSNPLIVVDGVPLAEGSSLNSISPNDIERIDVLKDAASAAIYGSRAGNGVILITTKSGQAGKTKIAFDFSSGVQVRADPVELADAYSAAQFFTEARDWGYVSRDPVNRKVTDDEATRIANGANKRELRLDYLQPYLEGQAGLTNTDWLDVIFRTAKMTNAHMSISGGSKSGNYYVSANYFHQEGLALGTDFKRMSGTIKVNSKMGKRFDFGLTLLPSYSRQDYTNLGDWHSDPIAASMIYYPFFDAYHPDGSIALSQGQILNTPADGSLQENPLAYTQIKDDRFRFRMFGSASLSYEVLRGLDIKMVLGQDYRNYFYDFFKPSTLGEYRAIAPVPAKASETNGRNLSYLSENTINYNRIFGAHELDVLVGYTYQREDGNESMITGTNIQDDLLDNVSGASSHALEADRYTWVQISYLGRLQYFFKDRYQFTGAIRRDGSSRFGNDSKWGVFPSLSAGWILSDEPNFPESKWFTYLKFRVSWGVTGNNQIGSYSSKALLSNSNYIYGGGLGPGFSTSTSPNNSLSWETNASFNLGLDFGLWDALSVSTNYYRSVTSDLLLSVPVPQQSGFSSSLQNIGEVENQGFELELSATNVLSGDVNWTWGANLTTNKNKVLALAEGQEEIRAGRDGAWRTSVGGAIAEITAYNIIGIYKTQEEVESSAHLSGTLIGDYIVEDVNGDGLIDDDDKVALGTFAPEFTFGFNSTWEWKNFDVALAINGVHGRSAYFYDEAVITGVGEGFGVPSKYYMDNRYHPENNPDGFLGRPNLGNFSAARRNTRISSIYIQDADYVRIRYVQIGYTFPYKWLANMGVTSLRLYATANNLLTITDYRGYNPDSSEYRRNTDVLRAGYAQDNYPMARSFLVGVDVKF